MRLSKRMRAAADFVFQGSKVADIGCDHAYTSIYLIENKIADYVIAMDINKGPLERAEDNIERHCMRQKIETRLSDGIHSLKRGEAEVLLIAGMGGALTVKILSDRPEFVAECRELILQPQSEIFLVRHYLHEIGFRIDEERMILEDGKYYFIIKAVPVPENIYEKEVFYLYGKKLLEQKDEVLKEFLLKEREKGRRVEEKLLEHPNERTGKRLLEIRKKLMYIKEGLEYYEM